MMQFMSVVRFKFGFSSVRMRNWSVGISVMVLTLIFIIRYEQSDHKLPTNHTVDDATIEGESVQEPAKKKPHFMTLEDLDYLFSNKSFYGEEEDDELNNGFLVWSRMRPFIERPDALPETAQGIEEATLAMKDLVFLIYKEKRASSSDMVSKEIRRNCPGFVAAFDGDLSGLRPVLELPCGLIEDSSITLVGIPDVHSRSFQVQLVGSGEARRPIILCYNVNFSKPFLVQNTWTEKLGWGNEVRCPLHGLVKNQIVDDLPLCNEQTGRIVLEESSNEDAVMDLSIGNADFPFLKGSPFTATLWTGLEGFHMTVNGRHETSFAYKEQLGPWLVSAVKVSGGLKLLSASATRLPVTDDHAFLPIEEKLKAPPLSGTRIALLVGVFSTGNNFKRRMALRRTWIQYEAVRSRKVAVRFIIGLHTNVKVNLEMWREAKAYGDIQFMPFVDYYGLLSLKSLKTVALCILRTKVIPAKYIMKTDDDAFVRIDELLSSLQEKLSNALLYGLISFDSSPDREQGCKWYIRKEEWPLDSYPPWAHGPGYIISHDIAKFVVKSHRQRDFRLFKLEDVAMGMWIQQYNHIVERVTYINDKRFHNSGCKSNYILVHYQTPRLILCLWEKLQKESQIVCCQ